jgi:hypothetical protein
MSETITPLVLDVLEWLAAGPRPYSEVMDAWRTSCPRLTIWEEANEQGFLTQTCDPNGKLFVEITELGRRFLEANGRAHLA